MGIFTALALPIDFFPTRANSLKFIIQAGPTNPTAREKNVKLVEWIIEAFWACQNFAKKFKKIQMSANKYNLKIQSKSQISGMQAPSKFERLVEHTCSLCPTDEALNDNNE